MLIVADRITGRSHLQADCRRDITGVYDIDLFTLVRVHLQDPSDTLFFVLGRIQHIRTGLAGTGIYAEERELSDERIGHDLERQRSERLVIRRLSRDVVALHVNTCDIRDVSRRRHEFDDCVQHLLYALVLMGAAAAYRHAFIGDRRLAKRRLQLIDGRLFTFKVFLHQVVIKVTDLFNQLGVVHFRVILHIIRNVYDGNVFTLGIVVDVSFHFKQVDDAFEMILFADRQLDHNGILAELRADLIDRIGHSRYIVCVSLPPDIL